MPKALLLRRLERLEAVSEIRDEAVVVRILYVDGDGSQTPGPVFHCARKASRPRRRRRFMGVDEQFREGDGVAIQRGASMQMTAGDRR
jgi:hypothetical protein